MYMTLYSEENFAWGCGEGDGAGRGKGSQAVVFDGYGNGCYMEEEIDGILGWTFRDGGGGKGEGWADGKGLDGGDGFGSGQGSGQSGMPHIWSVFFAEPGDGWGNGQGLGKESGKCLEKGYNEEVRLYDGIFNDGSC